MEIIKIEAYKIDIEFVRVTRMDLTDMPEEFNTYLVGIFELISSPSKSRGFVFKRDSTEVKTLIRNYFAAGDLEANSKEIADRLLQYEEQAQNEIQRLNGNIQKGLLFISHVNDEGFDKFIICKADYNAFFDETTFKKMLGLPETKKLYKAFLAHFNEDVENECLVFDTNKKFAKYWSTNFLDLDPIISDEDNTINAFDQIQNKILVKVRSNSKSDYVGLRNAVVAHFRLNEVFTASEFKEQVLDSYPFSSKKNRRMNYGEVFTNLVESGKFEPQFTIAHGKIKSKYLNVVPLRAEIDLNIKQDIKNLPGVVKAVKNEEGEKVVQIKSDTGFDYFKNLEGNE